jgi:hypothetical protein
MNKLAEMIAKNLIDPEDLVEAEELIQRSMLVSEGLKACQKNIQFPMGVSEVSCYQYTDSAGEYSSWGYCTHDGLFTCFCNWGGEHEIGKCYLNNFKDVFIAFENKEFKYDLERFLNNQIKEARKQD